VRQRFIEESPCCTTPSSFLVIALIAAVLGYGGIVTRTAELAKTAFFVFAGLSALAFLAGPQAQNLGTPPTQQQRTRT
jgi:uncharacterized membrane protein YtjA (UPF0391 family)